MGEFYLAFSFVLQDWTESLDRSVHSGRDGGTGRRSGLKIRRGQPRGGSTPPPGTNRIKGLTN